MIKEKCGQVPALLEQAFQQQTLFSDLAVGIMRDGSATVSDARGGGGGGTSGIEMPIGPFLSVVMHILTCLTQTYHSFCGSTTQSLSRI